MPRNTRKPANITPEEAALLEGDDQKGTSRPIRAHDETFLGVKAFIESRRPQLKAVGVRASWSSVGLALLLAYKAGRISEKHFGKKGAP